MPYTNYTHQAFHNSLAGKTSAFGELASAPTLYVGLSTSTPTMAGGNITEPSGGSYARVATDAADWEAATDADPSVLTNAAIIEFAQATASWGTVTHFPIFDALSGGNVIAYGELTTSRAVADTDTVRFAIGDLELQLKSPA